MRVRAYKCHIPLVVLYLVVFALCFASGVTLLVKANFVAAFLTTAETLRASPNAAPIGVDEQFSRRGNEYETAMHDLWLTMLIIGGLAIAVAILVLINLFLFLFLFFGPDNFLTQLPLGQNIRALLVNEALAMGVVKDKN